LEGAVPAPLNIFEASGSAAAMQAAMDLSAHGGKISVLGDYGEGWASFLWNQVLHKELEIIGSNAHAGAWEEAVRLAVEGGLPLERLVTHRLLAAQFAQGVALTAGRHGEVVKVVLDWSIG
jgi:threonine dehydrogenase-like Zn-dependent dehydrogenase